MPFSRRGIAGSPPPRRGDVLIVGGKEPASGLIRAPTRRASRRCFELAGTPADTGDSTSTLTRQGQLDRTRQDVPAVEDARYAPPSSLR